MPDPDAENLVAAFIEAACVPLDAHAAGALVEAEAILAFHPEVATANIHTAAIVGDDAAVRRFIDDDPASATAKGGPRDWDALTHLCFSRYLRLKADRSEAFVRAARALLDAGASANSGWFEPGHLPAPTWEGVLYGAAGVAHHAHLTRLLLARGADPNDDETVYHTPESYDNGALEALVETGRLTVESLTTILLRKLDWHDHDAIKWLLEQGVDPKLPSRWGRTALHHAILRDNDASIVDLLLDAGADPRRPFNGRTPVAMAARRGRGDVLASLRRRGVPLELDGCDWLIGACAEGDEERARDIAKRQPAVLRELLAEGGTLLAEFAATGNAKGARLLLELGVSVRAPYPSGNPYYGIPQGSDALHVAAWRGYPDVVRLLVERGASPDRPDANRDTPLALAVRACVASFWTHRRSPESVGVLLGAGASVHGIPYPSGYEDVDRLLEPHREGPVKHA